MSDARVPSVLIVGASTRAAAESAVRAGWRPICADAFADEDLCRIAPVRPLPNYPRGILPALRGVPMMPWIYTGGLENRPRLLDVLARQRPLLGNAGSVVRAVRDPFRWSAVFRDAGLPTLDLRRGSNPPSPDGRWLYKPLRGSGGTKIVVWDESLVASGESRIPTRHSPRFYFQRRAFGDSVSATFVAWPQQAVMVGCSRHFSASVQMGVAPFGWCGAVAPIALTQTACEMAVRCGAALARHFSLRGVFGVDFIWDGQTLWPVEINPRYPATLELLETALEEPLLAWHFAACTESSSEDTVRSPWNSVLSPSAYAAKFIAYAPTELKVPAWEPLLSRSHRMLADIPAMGGLIPAGTPVCTVLADGSDEASCLATLRKRISRLVSHFAAHGQPLAANLADLSEAAL